MRIGSLFSGAGGLDMAVEAVFGGHTVWHCEVDPAASKVLEHRWPGVPNLGDITTVDWKAVEPVDVLCGGFPCQDVSSAGKRAGLKNGTRTGLFVNLMAAVETLRPPFVVLENVLGLFTADGDEWPDGLHRLNARIERMAHLIEAIAYNQEKHRHDTAYWHQKEAERIRASRRYKRALAEFRRERLRLVPRAIATVLGSLAEARYDTQWHCLRASDVGAPHQRERIFILATVADADDNSAWRRLKRNESGWGWTQPAQHDSAAVELLPTARPDLLPTPGASDGSGGRMAARSGGVRDSGAKRSVPLTDLPLLLPTPAAARSGRNQSRSDGAAVRPSLDMIKDLLPTPTTQDGANCGGPSQFERNSLPLNAVATSLPPPSASSQGMTSAATWGKYESAIRRWESLTRSAPSPTEPNSNGNPQLAAGFSEWMQGWPRGWVTEFVALGLITRNDALRIIGNGVVPQQAEVALRWLLSISEVAA